MAYMNVLETDISVPQNLQARALPLVQRQHKEASRNDAKNLPV